MIETFRIAVPEADLEDLRRRLGAVRWPEAETVDDWSQGTPLAYLQEVCAYWRDHYDWRRVEARLNALPQFRTEIDGVDIHFLHVRSPHREASPLPLVITHGWPGSVVEFLEVVAPLTDPVEFGGQSSDAFDLVIPSLPGFGFSGKPERSGWSVQKIADTWNELMGRLGYGRYAAQGGDWGASVTTSIGVRHPDRCLGLHVNMPIARPDPETMGDLTELEKSALAGLEYYRDWDSGYSKQQSTRPQSVAYGLADSPAGQAGWILEKFWSWMDCDGHPENVVTRDQLLDNVMIYWLTNSAASSARLYWESFSKTDFSPVTVPAGCSLFPQEIFRASRRWVEKRYTNLVYWNEMDRGGHFAAFERPQVFVEELRACFRAIRALG